MAGIVATRRTTARVHSLMSLPTRGRNRLSYSARRLLVTACWLLVTVNVMSGPGAHAAFPGDNGRIVFNMAGGIYTMNPDGAGLRQLTGNNRPPFDSHPVWGPGGQRILFNRSGASGDRIWIMGAAGRNAAPLTAGKDPSWAPNGRRFAYTCSRPDVNDTRYQDLCVFHLPSGQSRPLMLGRGLVRLGESAWSPDGERIAYERAVDFLPGERYPTFNLFTVRPDGSDARRLTATPRISETSPQWSPVNESIVFARYERTYYDSTDHPRLLGLATIRRDGTHRRDLPDSMEEVPAWSPDGTKIVAIRPMLDRDFAEHPKPGIWLLTPQGSHLRRISDPITKYDYDRSAGVDWQARPVTG